MRIVLSLLIVLGLPAACWADRVALVIGNSAYTSVSELDNPQNDSAAVSAALRAQGFEVVAADNLGRTEMRDTLRRFRALADRSDVALVYYAGHGIEIGGVNYLVPVDARLEDERDAGLEMVEVDLVLGQISGAKTLKMVVLDACRNNPFIVRMQQQGVNRSVRQGLGDVRTNQADTLIAYAAAAGAITPDGRAGENSPFTAAFLGALSGPPMDVRRLLGRVRDQMRSAVPGAAPFVYSSLGGGEYVINPRSLSLAPTPTPTPAPASPAVNTAQRSISVDFVRIDRNGSIEDWNEFLIRYEDQSDHPLYAFALEKRQSLQGSTSARPVEPGKEEQTQPDQRTAITAPTMTADQAARSIQVLLKQRSCYFGKIDGVLGRNSKRGLATFSGQAGVAITLPPSPDATQLQVVLTALGAHPGIQCPRVARRSKPSTPPTATTPAASDADIQKPKSKEPVFSTLPCPKAEDLKFDRPECH